MLSELSLPILFPTNHRLPATRLTFTIAVWIRLFWTWLFLGATVGLLG